MNPSPSKSSLPSFSLTAKAGTLLAAIIFTSLVGMLGTLLIVENIDGDAARINVAGSLRMLAIRISRAYLENIVEESQYEDTRTQPDMRYQLPSKTRLLNEVANFEKQLGNPLLRSSSVRNSELVQQKLQHIEVRWEAIKAKLIQQEVPASEALPLFDQFVEEVDHFVTLTQNRSESQVKLLRTLQSTGLLVTLVISIFILLGLYHKVILPLKELVRAARAAEKGDFNHRLNDQSDDELGELAHAFNTMSANLAIAWHDFETRVAQKTHDLQQLNDSLELLYHSTQELSENPHDTPMIEKLISQLQQATGLKSVRLCLTQSQDQQFKAITPYNQPTPAVCDRNNCETCIRRGNPEASSTQNFDIKSTDGKFGFLTIEPFEDRDIESWQVRLIEILVDNLRHAFTLYAKNEQASRLLLLEERNAIARELHDSLAQSLSYLRFQVTRFQMLLSKEAPQEELIKTSNEIQQGLGNAYQQLRELLTTFRLKIDEPGLEQALKGTIAEFSQRGEFNITLDYQLKNITPGPHEEIHLLQIVRESLSNVLKHAQAKNVSIRFSELPHHQISVVIEDDGVGLPENRKRINHHGMAILEERASQMNGIIALENRDEGGVRVKLVCQMDNLHSNHEPAIALRENP